MNTINIRSTKFKILYLIVLGMAITPLKAQNENSLDNYIQEAFRNNLVLQQKNVTLEKALSSLEEAKSLFLPQIDLSADYLTGYGGRFIDIPVGDMLNPVYTSLNFLMQTDQFPQLENIKQNFFPKNQIDIKVRTSVPIYHSDIIHNKAIQGIQYQLKAIEIETYKRELVAQIKNGYFQYLMALENIKIYENAQTLVQKNVKINESLLENGKGLHVRVLRAKTELEQVSSQLNNAKLSGQNAQYYFNFLLNKPLQSEISTELNPVLLINEIIQDTTNYDVENREELKMIQSGKDIYTTKIKMQKQFYTPNVSAFADLGNQSEEFKFNQNSLYYLIGLQVKVPIFNRPQKFKLQQTQIDLKLSDLQFDQTSKQLSLGLEVSKNDLKTSITNYLLSLKQQEAAASYFRLIEKGYQKGIFTLIEYIDARNQWTVAQTLVNINTFKVLQSKVSVERHAASFTISQ